MFEAVVKVISGYVHALLESNQWINILSTYCVLSAGDVKVNRQCGLYFSFRIKTNIKQIEYNVRVLECVCVYACAK